MRLRPRALTERPELAGASSPAVAAAELAAHWDNADEPARALPARVQAGLAAEHTRAYAEADQHCQRALELWDRVPDPDQLVGLDEEEVTAAANRAVGR